MGNQLGAGGRAHLVVDDLQLLALLRQTQHGLGEVAAVQTVHPAGAKDQVRAAAESD
jgi:hypothetical protein